MNMTSYLSTRERYGTLGNRLYLALFWRIDYRLYLYPTRRYYLPLAGIDNSDCLRISLSTAFFAAYFATGLRQKCQGTLLYILFNDQNTPFINCSIYLQTNLRRGYILCGRWFVLKIAMPPVRSISETKLKINITNSPGLMIRSAFFVIPIL